MAEQLIGNLAHPFDASKYVDDYRDNLLRIINAKLKGEKIEVAEPAGDRYASDGSPDAAAGESRTGESCRERSDAGGPDTPCRSHAQTRRNPQVRVSRVASGRTRHLPLRFTWQVADPMTVLLVDDDLDSRLIYGRVLSHAGYSCAGGRRRTARAPTSPA